jgi:uncharacterized membrane protein
VDGEVSKDLKPTILAILLFGLVALVYNIPQVAVGIASLAEFPTEYFLLIIGFVALWFFCTVLLLRSRLSSTISNITESAYRRSLERDINKEK